MEGEGTVYIGSSPSPLLRIKGLFKNGYLTQSTEFYVDQLGTLDKLTNGISKFTTNSPHGKFSWDGSVLTCGDGESINAENRETQLTRRNKLQVGTAEFFEALSSLTDFETYFHTHKNIVSNYEIHSFIDARLNQHVDL
jgi:hypothetical protein